MLIIIKQTFLLQISSEFMFYCKVIFKWVIDTDGTCQGHLQVSYIELIVSSEVYKSRIPLV